MKDNKKCLKFKEMIMEKIDGEANASVLKIVSNHIQNCPDCLAYEKSLKKMIELTSLMKVEAPDYLETRIMATIDSTKPQFNWFPVISYGTTFAVAIIAAFFLIYNKPFAPSQVAVLKSVVVEKQLVASIKAPVQVAKVNVAKINKTIMQSSAKAQDIAINTATKDKLAVRELEVSAKPAVAIAIQPVANDYNEKGPVRQNIAAGNNIIQSASAPVAANNPNYGVSAIEVKSVMNAAEVKPIPTETGLPLLEQNKAIVANNLINPNHGDFARIVIKVEENTLVKIMIYDKAGRVVTKILDEEKAPGTFEARWYGKNDYSQIVAEGAYFVYIQIGKRVIKSHIIVNKD
ncbi:MAG: hypothetical protein WCJ94_05645 [bacterium]